MKKIFSLILIFLFSCTDKKMDNSLISNDFIPNLDYSINLDWDNMQSRSITEVHIKWDRWKENDSTSFLSTDFSKRVFAG